MTQAVLDVCFLYLTRYNSQRRTKARPTEEIGPWRSGFSPTRGLGKNLRNGHLGFLHDL